MQFLWLAKEHQEVCLEKLQNDFISFRALGAETPAKECVRELREVQTPGTPRCRPVHEGVGRRWREILGDSEREKYAKYAAKYILGKEIWLSRAQNKHCCGMLRWNVVKRWTVRLVVVPLKVYCAYYLFGTYIGGARMVCGPSMLPTFSASTEWIIEDVLSVRLGRPLARGELVVLNSPRVPNGQICKRIIGLPGDVVCVDPSGARGRSTEHCLIPRGHIWIAGDNAAASLDSRDYGPVSMALVRSRVVARIFPWKSRTIFRNGATVLGEA